MSVVLGIISVTFEVYVAMGPAADDLPGKQTITSKQLLTTEITLSIIILWII